MLVPLSSNFNIMLISLSRLLLKRMENVDSIIKFGNIDNTPLPKNVNPNFLNSSSYTEHRLPIARFKSTLNSK